MGKEINLSEEIGDITAGAEALAKATKRIEENRSKKGGSQKLTVVEKKNVKGETSGGKQRAAGSFNQRKKENEHFANNEVLDPWVTMPTKIRLSKKCQLHELSVLRGLAGRRPFQKKDLFDAALDVIFERFRLPMTSQGDSK